MKKKQQRINQLEEKIEANKKLQNWLYFLFAITIILAVKYQSALIGVLGVILFQLMSGSNTTNRIYELEIELKGGKNV